MEDEISVKTNENSWGNDKKKKETVFLVFMMAFPLLQFVVFYIGVNLNSILLAFKSYDGSNYYFNGFINFKGVYEAIFTTGELFLSVKNSAIQFLMGLIIGMPLQIMVAFTIFKKVPFSSFYKVMLFMPSMISSLVFVICARQLIQEGFPIIFSNPDLIELLNPVEYSSFWTVLIFGLWMTFAGGLVIYLSAMCSISVDVMEYASLEKMNSLQELWYIVIPSIFPTITTYLVVAIAGFFTNYGYFFSFFGGEGRGGKPFDTLGYYFFVKIAGDNVLPIDYPFAAAGGVAFTIIVAPITLLTKWLLEKFGPSEE